MQIKILHPPTPPGPTAQIPLGNGLFALVDSHNFHALIPYAWRLRKSHSIYYVTRRANHYGKRKTIFMHRQIMQPRPDQQTHHINSNPLDNREKNLQNVTLFEHAQIQRLQRITRHAPPKSGGTPQDFATWSYIKSASHQHKQPAHRPQ